MTQGVYNSKALIISNIISLLIFPFYKSLNILRKKYDLRKITINNLLILEYHRIVDVILILSVLRAIRVKYPNSKIYHYGSYEITALLKLTSFHKVKGIEYDHYLNLDKFVNLVNPFISSSSKRLSIHLL